MNLKLKLLVLSLLPLWLSAQTQVRTETLLEKGWKFTRDDNPQFKEPAFDDTQWQSVRIPHDWAIYGPFSINNDKQNIAIVQDGQQEAMDHAGRTGGLPFVGTGWYRLQFDTPELDKNKKYTLVFDGAMSHARIYINGQEACYWPNGYNSFFVDATPFLVREGKNLLAVRLENFPESSRLVSRSRTLPQRTPHRHQRSSCTGMGYANRHRLAQRAVCQNRTENLVESSQRQVDERICNRNLAHRSEREYRDHRPYAGKRFRQLHLRAGVYRRESRRMDSRNAQPLHLGIENL